MSLWNEYYDQLFSFDQIEVQTLPENIDHNGHIFFIKLKDVIERVEIIEHLKSNKIESVFHYIPLHESKKCAKYNYFYGEDNYTTIESQRILRLPIHNSMDVVDVKYVCNKVREFFDG